MHRIHAVSISTRSSIIALAVNALLAAVKGVTGVVGNSYALIADAVESTADIASSLVVFGGIRIASWPPDADHPYGHGKAEPLSGMLVAIGLGAAALALAIQSIREISTPHHAPAAFTLAVLVGVVVTKELLFRFVFKVGESAQSTALKSDAWHHRSDAITSAAAFVGISVALLGGKGYESADDWAALFASGIIVYNAWRLVRPAIAEVMDAAPSPDVAARVRNVASRVEGVVALEKCYIRKMGFEFYVDLHVIVNGGLPVRSAHEIAHKVKDAIRSSDPRIAEVLIHIEPAEEVPEAGGSL